jgi:hypothetical protein
MSRIATIICTAFSFGVVVFAIGMSAAYVVSP